MNNNPTPSPFELWAEANGDRQRYHDLMVQHGHILRPGDEGYAVAKDTLACGVPVNRADGEEPAA